MRRFRIVLWRGLFWGLLGWLGAASPTQAQPLEFPRVSPKATVSQTIGLTTITITYGRPAVRGRTIWGDLVPYGQVWRTGANEATTIEFTDDVLVEGHRLPAGKYSMFTIPGEKEWTLIFNREWNLWGAFTYDQVKDKEVLRIQVRPQPAEYTEWLQFSFEDMTPASLQAPPNTTRVVLHWERIRVGFTVQVEPQTTHAKVLAQCRSAIASLKADDWQTPARCANYCLQNDVGTDVVPQWIEKSIAIQENASNLGLKARWLARNGQISTAIQVAERAIQLGKARNQDVSALEKLVAEWKAKQGSQ
ncbi:MAG: DUF2911 domain-containing protein [Acidobacteria bacterium]|nr:DUF2911 domain-containing protein [Acidobacteriota bacterium]MDW7984694.1 DUF2911 domain-containing protein [Acidobacteriota bacterium]